MPAKPTPGPTDQERRIYGELVDDILYLRNDCGFYAARFKGDYRIGNEVLTAAGVREKACTERRRRSRGQAATALPATPPTATTSDKITDIPNLEVAKIPPKVEPPSAAKRSPFAAKCQCGRPENHNGRCWARRGLSGPPAPTSMKERIAALEKALADLRAQVEALR